MIEQQPFSAIKKRDRRDLPSKRYQYNCINPKSLYELECIIENSRTISWSTFIRNVEKEDIKELERLGNWLPLKTECYASFHKSITPDGKIVYYFKHSAIEYIFY